MMKSCILFVIWHLTCTFLPIDAFCPVPVVTKTVLRASDRLRTKQQSLCLSKTFKQDEEESTQPLNDTEQIILGSIGTTMGMIVLVSEYVLKTNGCGLPAGPFGLLGAAEGISYLGVTAIAAFSLYTKVRTGSGLPAGPKGLLGLAEGLSFLAITVGIGVLGFQLIDYGYIPNFVPMEDGMCQ